MSSVSTAPPKPQLQPTPANVNTLPTGSQFKLKQRKREVVTKHEPEAFRDALLNLLPESCDIDTYASILESSAEKLDYKRYAEAFFEFTLIGGIVAPGGQLVDDGARLNPFSIFACDKNNTDQIRQRVEILNKLIRRYKYLQRKLEETLVHVLQYVNKFGENAQKLSTAVGMLISIQQVPMSILSNLIKEHLVKDGASLQFVTGVFQTYLAEQNIENLSTLLVRTGLDDKLLEFFPVSKRKEEFLVSHFEAEGLKPLVDFYKKRQGSAIKYDIKGQIIEMIQAEKTQQEVAVFVKQQVTSNSWTESETVTLLWDTIIESVDWSGRPEQLEQQLVKAMNTWPKVLEAFCTSPKTEIALLQRVQNMCYEDARFMKHFKTIVVTLYKNDIVSEAAVRYWYEKGATAQGKAVFQKQIESFVEWLKSQEDDDDEDDDE